MRRIAGMLFGITLLLAHATSSAAAEPFATLSPVAATYEVRLNNLPFKAKATQALFPLGGDRWRLELKVESFLLDTLEYSEFRWDGENCHTIPETYSYMRKGIGKRKQLHLAFDHARQRVTRDDGKEKGSYPIGPQTEDKLGHTLAIACRVARGARGALHVDVAWDRDVRSLDYNISRSEETVETPAGIFRALRMERARTDSDRVTTSWIAPSANWHPVKMQHTEGDGRLFQLRLLEMNHAAPR